MERVKVKTNRWKHWNGKYHAVYYQPAGEPYKKWLLHPQTKAFRTKRAAGASCASLHYRFEGVPLNRRGPYGRVCLEVREVSLSTIEKRKIPIKA